MRRIPLCALISTSLILSISNHTYFQSESFIFLLSSALAMTFIPGYLVLNLIAKNSHFDEIEVIPISFSLGVSLLAIPSLILYLTRANAVILYYVSILFSLAAVYYFYAREEKDTGHFEFFSLTYRFQTVILILLGVGCSLIAGYAARFYADGGDLSRLAAIRQLFENLEAIPYGPYFKDKYYHHSSNSWFLITAVLVKVSSCNLFTGRAWFTGILTFTGILAYYAVAKHLFNDRYLAFLSSLIAVGIYFLYRTYVSNWDLIYFSLIAEPGVTAELILFPISLVFLMRYLARGSKEDLFLTGLNTSCLVLIHPQWYFAFFLYLLSYSLGILFFRQLRKEQIFRSIEVVLVVLFISIPMLLQMYTVYEGTSTPTTGGLEGMPHRFRTVFVFYTEDFWAVRPLNLVGDRLSLIALCLTALFIFSRIEKTKTIFAVSVMTIPKLIVINPLLLPPLAGLISTPISYRLISSPPFEIMLYAYFAGIILLSGCSFLQGRLGLNVLFPLLSLFLLLSTCLVFPRTTEVLESFIDNKRKYMLRLRETEKSNPLISHIRRKWPPQSILISDLQTSYMIPAFTNTYTVTRRETQIVWDGAERSLATNMIFDPNISVADTLILLERYSVNFILVNKRLGSHRSSMEKFDSNPLLFEKEYDDAFNRTYKVNYKNGTVLTKDLFQKSQALEGEQRYEEAFVLTKEALTLEPENKDYLSCYARLKEKLFHKYKEEGEQHIIRKNWLDALSSLESAIKYKNDNDVHTLIGKVKDKLLLEQERCYKEGTQLLESNEHEKAFEQYRLALKYGMDSNKIMQLEELKNRLRKDGLFRLRLISRDLILGENVSYKFNVPPDSPYPDTPGLLTDGRVDASLNWEFGRTVAIDFSLGGNYFIDKVKTRRSHYSYEYIKKMRLFVSSNGKNFSKVSEIEGPYIQWGGWYFWDFPVNTDASNLRLELVGDLDNPVVISDVEILAFVKEEKGTSNADEHIALGLEIDKENLHCFTKSQNLYIYNSDPFPSDGDGKTEHTILYKDGEAMTSVHGWGCIKNENQYSINANSSVIIGRKRKGDLPKYTLDYVRKTPEKTK